MKLVHFVLATINRRYNMYDYGDMDKEMQENMDDTEDEYYKDDDDDSSDDDTDYC